ncbi:MAG: hypothetical protein EOP34_09685 [Rickettsiales bacterium]|nr:MAG: hypothetical protein EOP34_09685 [Rickettsiales bacterium]
MKITSTQHSILSAYYSSLLYVRIKKSVLYFVLLSQAYKDKLSFKGRGCCTTKSTKIAGKNGHCILLRFQYSNNSEAKLVFMQFSSHQKSIIDVY